MLIELRKIIPSATVAELRGLIGEEAFVSGADTAHGSARSVKQNLQLSPSSDAAEAAARLLLGVLGAHPVYRSAALPRDTTRPRFAKYGPGMSYGEHLDAPLMGDPPLRTDIAVTVFLSDASSYDGGELVIDTDLAAQQVKLNAGDCVLYPASTLHRVDTVTRGERLVANFWIQSLVRDPAQRRILFDLAGVLQRIDEGAVGVRVTDALRRCEVNLVRMWANG